MMATLQGATPLVLTALGGMFSERSGVVNIGLEGMMLIGAFGAVAATFFTNNPWIGVLVAVLSGGMLAAAHAIVCVKFKGNHIVSGTGVILFGVGFTTLMLGVVWGRQGYSPQVEQLPRVNLQPFIGDIPVVGRAFGSQSPIVYWMFIIAIISWYVMYKTPFGLRLRAAGEDPSSLDAAGVNVEWIRFIGVFLSGCLAGLGGAYLSIGFGSAFGKVMTNGRGFIALAALIFGNWTPVGCLLAGLFFGFLNGLQFALVLAPGFEWLQPYSNFIQMIPFVLVIVALAGIRKSVPPKGIAVPYEKEARV
ncbi:MAG: ABC transporter permease [Candidatus Thorarchaeota archaeon]|nr:ABC transporter permease [Candidatus Thorarchaeota archaeon]